LKIWGNIKFTSLPQQINASLVKVPNEVLSVMKRLEINEIARGIEFSGGFDCRICKIPLNSYQLLTLSFIGAYGGSTPDKPDDTVRIYKLPNRNTAETEYQEVTGELKKIFGVDLAEKEKEYVAFVNADRKRFFRQIFFGFRVKTYTKPKVIPKPGSNKIVERFEFLFPSVFEVTLGRNDFIANNDLYKITGLRKDKKNLMVLSLGGILPVRVARGMIVYLFGTAMLHFNKRIDQYSPVILEPAQDDIKYMDAKVGRITFFDESRDYYRFGIGIELSSALTGVVKNIVRLFSISK